MALAGHLNTLALYEYCTFVEFNDTLAWNASLGFMFGAIDLCTERHDPSKAKASPVILDQVSLVPVGPVLAIPAS